MKVPMVYDFNKFINTEIYQMNLYIAACRTLGDTRPDNDICFEWIQDNAEKFRENFIMVNDHA